VISGDNCVGVWLPRRASGGCGREGGGGGGVALFRERTCRVNLFPGSAAVGLTLCVVRESRRPADLPLKLDSVSRRLITAAKRMPLVTLAQGVVGNARCGKTSAARAPSSDDFIPL